MRAQRLVGVLLLYNLVYKKHIVQYLEYFKKIIEISREKKLLANLKKNHLLINGLVLLDHVVSSKGTKMDPSKIETITSLTKPKSLHYIEVFLVLHHFIGD